MDLISVIAVTYNSSSFIIENLESIYNQTWSDIELIITDDNSTDNTVDICRQWLEKKDRRFHKTKVCISKVNTGVSGNANRGLKEATGQWIKCMAGDDALLPDALNDNMLFISSHPEIRVLFSKVNNYYEFFTPANYLGTSPQGEIREDSLLSWDRSAESQYKMLLLSDRIHFTPSAFMHRKTLLSVGGFDDRIRWMEDHPLWLNLTKNGHKLYFMDKGTVNYRRHSQAVNNTGKSCLINPNYFRAEAFRRLYTYPFLPPVIRAEQKFRWLMSQIFKIDLLNRPSMFNRFLLNLLTVYLNPFRYMIKLRKILMRNPGGAEFYT